MRSKKEMEMEMEGRELEKKKEQVFSGIIVDSSHGFSESLVSSDLTEISKLAHHLIAIHVSSDYSNLWNGPEFWKGFPVMKKINLRGSGSRENLAKKFIKRLAKRCAAMALMLEIDPTSPLTNWIAIAGNYANRLPENSIVLAVHKGTTIFKRKSLVPQLEGFTLDLRTELYEETESDSVHSCKDIAIRNKSSSEDENKEGLDFHYTNKSHLDSISQARSMSVVQWVMSLPTRSNRNDSRFENKHKAKKSSSSSFSFVLEDSPESTPGWPLPFLSTSKNLDLFREYTKGEDSELLTESRGILNRPKPSPYKRFSYEELENATSGFSKENFIGEGGCSMVHRGNLRDGKSVVVKSLKPYKEASDDFSREVDIVSSIKHKCIAPLVGICVENECLMSVYDYFPKGSLEESLHVDGKRCTFPWEKRFRIAVEIAGALSYLHDECSRPIIHRDVKSSNILLSDEFEPKLSDFGIAIWGPKDSREVINSDVVGTFGCIAPEYLMQGRVSDKIDVYALGVLLLELLSGRSPISAQPSDGPQSLVKWAKDLLKNKDLDALLDPKLNEDLNAVEAQRMVLAASLCINNSARRRPTAIEVVKLLRGEKGEDELVNYDAINDENEIEDEDNPFVDLDCKSYMDFAMLNTLKSLSRSKIISPRLKLGDYLKQPQ